MQILLDTHVFLWWLTDARKLGRSTCNLISDGGTRVFVSAASFWEIAIKRSLGRIDADLSELRKALGDEGFEEIPITIAHASAIVDLPELHRDPFDRLLMVQSIVERCAFLSRDEQVLRYADVAGLKLVRA